MNPGHCPECNSLKRSSVRVTGQDDGMVRRYIHCNGCGHDEVLSTHTPEEYSRMVLETRRYRRLRRFGKVV